MISFEEVARISLFLQSDSCNNNDNIDNSDDNDNNNNSNVFIRSEKNAHQDVTCWMPKMRDLRFHLFSYIIPKSRYIKETPQQQRILFTFGLHQDLFQRRTDDSISLV